MSLVLVDKLKLLVISLYAPCIDITNVITPDVKQPGQSVLMFVDLSGGYARVGGSALAHVFGQIGIFCFNSYFSHCSRGLVSLGQAS